MRKLSGRISYSARENTISNIHIAVLGIVSLICIVAMFAPMFKASPATQTPPSEPSALLLIVIGFVIGCYGTIVGIGGGPLIVPILIFFYGWDNEFLVATSLFVVFLNATSGSIGYAFQKRIDYSGGIKLSLAALPGAFLSGMIHNTFKIPMFDVIFGIFLILLAVWLIIGAQRLDENTVVRLPAKRTGLRQVTFKDAFGVFYNFYVDDKLGIYLNLALGFFVGFLGIGGGVFQVPIMLFILLYPAHLATATSHFITATTCLFALIPHLFLGNVMFASALPIGVGIIAGAQLGAKLANRIHSRALVYLFVIVLVVFALELFL
jgi:uncharacterized membrane protein YfcA